MQRNITQRFHLLGWPAVAGVSAFCLLAASCGGDKKKLQEAEAKAKENEVKLRQAEQKLQKFDITYEELERKFVDKLIADKAKIKMPQPETGGRVIMVDCEIDKSISDKVINTSKLMLGSNYNRKLSEILGIK